MKATPALSALLGLVLFLQAGVCRAANAYAVKTGDWKADIWSSSGGGPPEPGLRPGNEGYDRVQFRKNGVRVTVSTDVGSIQQIFLNNNGAQTVLQLNPGARVETQFLALATDGGKSTVEVGRDASLTVGIDGVRVAHKAKGEGTLNISEGAMTVSGRFILSGNETTGVVNFASGTLAAPFVETGFGTATFSWTGGTLRAEGSDLKTFENTGSGVLDIGMNGCGAFLHKGSGQTYLQGSGASMRIEIKSGKFYDQFLSEGSSGRVVLDGSLEIHLLDGYRPRPGDHFDIVSASQIVDKGLELRGPAGAAFQAEVLDGKDGQIFRLKAR
jgi:hypothetical protein